MPAAVVFDRVTHAFAPPTPVVADVSATISPGEFVGIVGPSGCGKSTLLRLAAGLIAPTQGEVQLEQSQSPPRVAFVFQDPTLLPWRTALDNVLLPLEIAGKTADSAARAKDALALVGLAPDDANKFPRELSGGMRMRVSLARAIVTQPDVLLLDEPFAALDDLLRQQLNEELLRLWEAQRWTALFVTHNVGEAVFLSRRVLIVSPRPGTIVADVPVPFADPRTPALRALPDFAALVAQIGARLRQGAAA